MKYFGTDGIRGIAFEFISLDLAYSVGRSMGILEKKKIIIARDTRESGKKIVEAIKSGIVDSGLEVLDIDILATPILALMTIKESCYGIMVTASHNPYQDNGIKIFNKGKKSIPQEEAIIEQVIDGKIVLKTLPGGKILPYINPIFDYSSLFKDIIVKSNLKITLDFSNGAAIKSGKYIFNMISDNLVFIGDEPNGKNINENVGSTHIEKLSEIVKSNKGDIGFAFDGDGDRVLTVDKNGKVIDGDLMIYIFASYLKKKNQLDNDTVILTKMSNLGIIDALEKQGIKVIQTDIGDKYVFRALDEYGSVLGGENSGHVINKNLFISGDGILNAAYLIKILHDCNCEIDSFINDVIIYPDRLFNLRDIDKSLVNDQRIISLVEKIKSELNGKGKVLVRASGTEPLVRISASAISINVVDEIIERIANKFKEISKWKR